MKSSFQSVRGLVSFFLTNLIFLIFPTILFAGWQLYEETSIKGTTSSISRGVILKTSSGNVYEVTSGRERSRERNPTLMVLKNGSTYQLIIEGFDDKFSANCLVCKGGRSAWKIYEETSIDGTTDSVSSGTIIKSRSGHIYEVTSG